MKSACSVDEYQRLRRGDRQVLTLDDLSAEDLEASRAPDAAKASDTELT